MPRRATAKRTRVTAPRALQQAAESAPFEPGEAEPEPFSDIGLKGDPRKITIAPAPVVLQGAAFCRIALARAYR